MIDVIKKLISGIRKFCVFLFWSRKSDKNRYDDRNQQKKISELFDKAVVNPRLRQNFDLRDTDDNGQRILNALMPGTVVPIHRHPNSNESVIILCGKLIEITYDDNGNETERIHLDPSLGNFGCVVPAGAWHTVEVLEPSVIFEAKDGKYGEDGSETI